MPWWVLDAKPTKEEAKKLKSKARALAVSESLSKLSSASATASVTTTTTLSSFESNSRGSSSDSSYSNSSDNGCSYNKPQSFYDCRKDLAATTIQTRARVYLATKEWEGRYVRFIQGEVRRIRSEAKRRKRREKLRKLLDKKATILQAFVRGCFVRKDYVLVLVDRGDRSSRCGENNGAISLMDTVRKRRYLRRTNEALRKQISDLEEETARRITSNGNYKHHNDVNAQSKHADSRQKVVDRLQSKQRKLSIKARALKAVAEKMQKKSDALAGERDRLVAMRMGTSSKNDDLRSANAQYKKDLQQTMRTSKAIAREMDSLLLSEVAIEKTTRDRTKAEKTLDEKVESALATGASGAPKDDHENEDSEFAADVAKIGREAHRKANELREGVLASIPQEFLGEPEELFPNEGSRPLDSGRDGTKATVGFTQSPGTPTTPKTHNRSKIHAPSIKNDGTNNTSTQVTQPTSAVLEIPPEPSTPSRNRSRSGSRTSATVEPSTPKRMKSTNLDHNFEPRQTPRRRGRSSSITRPVTPTTKLSAETTTPEVESPGPCTPTTKASPGLLSHTPASATQENGTSKTPPPKRGLYRSTSCRTKKSTWPATRVVSPGPGTPTTTARLGLAAIHTPTSVGRGNGTSRTPPPRRGLARSTSCRTTSAAWPLMESSTRVEWPSPRTPGAYPSRISSPSRTPTPGRRERSNSNRGSRTGTPIEETTMLVDESVPRTPTTNPGVGLLRNWTPTPGERELGTGRVPSRDRSTSRGPLRSRGREAGSHQSPSSGGGTMALASPELSAPKAAKDRRERRDRSRTKRERSVPPTNTTRTTETKNTTKSASMSPGHRRGKKENERRDRKSRSLPPVEKKATGRSKSRGRSKKESTDGDGPPVAAVTATAKATAAALATARSILGGGVDRKTKTKAKTKTKTTTPNITTARTTTNAPTPHKPRINLKVPTIELNKKKRTYLRDGPILTDSAKARRRLVALGMNECSGGMIPDLDASLLRLSRK